MQVETSLFSLVPQSERERLEQGKLSWKQQQRKPCQYEPRSAPPRGGVGPWIHTQEQEVLPGESPFMSWNTDIKAKSHFTQRIHVGAVNVVGDAALSFFQHDDRDGEKTWIDNRGRGRGAFPARRGRFVYRKGGSSPKWTHDMFQGGEEGGLGDDSMEVACKENSKNAGDAPTLKQ